MLILDVLVASGESDWSSWYCCHWLDLKVERGYEEGVVEPGTPKGELQTYDILFLSFPRLLERAQ